MLPVLLTVVLMVSSCELFGGHRFSMEPRTVYTAVLKAAPAFKNTALGTDTLRSPRAFYPRNLGDSGYFVYASLKDYNPEINNDMQGIAPGNFFHDVNSSIEIAGYNIEDATDNLFSPARSITTTFDGFTTGTDVVFEGGGTRSANSTSYDGDWERTYYWGMNGATEGQIQALTFEKENNTTNGVKNLKITYLDYTPEGAVLVDQVYHYVQSSTAGAGRGTRTYMNGDMSTGDCVIKGAKRMDGMDGTDVGTLYNEFLRYEASGNNKEGGYLLLHVSAYNTAPGSQLDLATATVDTDSWIKVTMPADSTAIDTATSYTSLAALVSGETDPEGYAEAFGTEELEPFTLAEVSHSFEDFTGNNTPVGF
jgi:hypothetical protein